MRVHLDFLAEGVGQPREPAHAHPHREVVPLDVRRADVLRVGLSGDRYQDTRCWYYRGGWSCYRAGGNICYADTPTAMNREHAFSGRVGCVAVSPSDTAPALVALEAEMVIRRGDRERIVPAEDFFLGPGVDIMRMTVLRSGDLLTAIRLPETWAGAQFYFEKVR